MENSKELLLSKGIKPTYQRLKILKFLEESRTHATVDMIYQSLLREIPTMSRTTVYNTLKSFLEKGIVKTVEITGTEARYDLDITAHHHFLCEKCGRIIDIDIICPNMARREVDGHVIKEIHGYFKGICSDCLAGGPASESGAAPARTVTADDETPAERRANMKKYRCTVCGYVYNPDEGDPDRGVQPGTAFEQVPEDWVCPLCGVGKDMFEPVEE